MKNKRATEAVFEVTDDYGKVWFTGTLMACGVWIDPICGIDFDRSGWGDQEDGAGIDDDRFALNPDGSYTVKMYNDTAGLGMGGEMVVRPVAS